MNMIVQEFACNCRIMYLMGCEAFLTMIIYIDAIMIEKHEIGKV
jgi:hypothetical protein